MHKFFLPSELSDSYNKLVIWKWHLKKSLLHSFLWLIFNMAVAVFFFGNPFQGNVPTLPKATITRKLCVSRTAWRCISLTGPCGDCNLLQCLCCPHEEFHFFYQRNSFILLSIMMKSVPIVKSICGPINHFVSSLRTL